MSKLIGQFVTFDVYEDNPDYRYGDLNRPSSYEVSYTGKVIHATANEKHVMAVVEVLDGKLIDVEVGKLKLTSKNKFLRVWSYVYENTDYPTYGQKHIDATYSINNEVYKESFTANSRREAAVRVNDMIEEKLNE